MWVLDALFPLIKTIQQPTPSNIITSLWVFVTFVFGVVAVVYFFRDRTSLQKRLSSALQCLKGKNPDTVRDSYNDIKREMESILGNLWLAYDRSLVRSRDNSGQISIHSTAEARWFFNENTIIIPRLSIGFYNALPGVFTGWGILGTFVGLTLGLAQLNIGSDTVEGLRQGIEGMLSGMSLAFSSSLWGILISLIFLIITRLCLRKVYDMVGELQQAVDEAFPILTSEQLLENCLWEAREQSKELKRFNEDLAISIATALDEKLSLRLDPTFDKLLGAIEQLTQVGSSELGQVISSQMGAEIKNLSEILDAVGNNLRSISDYITASQEKLTESVQNILEQFSSKISDALSRVNQQQDTLVNQIKNSIGDFADKTKAIMDYLQRSLKEQVSQTAESMEGMSAKLSEQVGDIVDRMKALVGDYRREREELDNQWQKIGEMMRVVQENMSAFAGNAEVIRQATNQLLMAIKQWDEKQTEFGAMVEKSQQQLHGYIEYTKEILDVINTSNSRLQLAWQAYEKRFDTLRDDLEKVFEELSKGLVEYTQLTGTGVETFLQQMDKYMNSITGYLSGAIENLRESVSELSEAVERFGKLKTR